MSVRIPLIRAIVGSTAYGLAREGSDVDHLGVYAWPTDAFWHLGALEQSVVQHEPFDMTEHEVAKYLGLALKCNPSLVELLWLPDENYEILHPLGEELIKIRQCFLSTNYVRSAYGGYALQQAIRLERRAAEGKDGFSSDTKNRTPKHARHCFRLLDQGRQILETGELRVKVDDPEMYWAFDNMPVEEILAHFKHADILFKATPSVLPDSPDYLRVDQFLFEVRRTLLE